MEAKNLPIGISAAAYAYQLAISQQPLLSTEPESTETTPVNVPHSELVKETTMIDQTTESETPGLGRNGNAHSPLPARTSTPVPTNAIIDNSSRAASQHPEVGPPPMPTYTPPHGAPARQYLNSKVTATLLEGMKQLAKDQPSDPLRVLGEFLLQKSKEIEGS